MKSKVKMKEGLRFTEDKAGHKADLFAESDDSDDDDRRRTSSSPVNNERVDACVDM